MQEKNMKKICMQGEPHVEKCPFAIQWLGAYVIVIGVSNHSGCINPISLKWGLLRPRRDESINYF